MPQNTSLTVTTPGGITFGVARPTLSLVADNGVDPIDVRVMRRTNEAIQELLLSTDPRTNGPLIPVGCMASYFVTADTDGNILLPPQLENALSYFIVPPGNAYGDSDTSQGWYSLLNPATYVDPYMVHDNPLIDYGLVPDPSNPTVLRRRFGYNGATPLAVVAVTGKKRYIPITSDADYLIIQNVPALKMMIQAIERREARNGLADGQAYKAEAIKMLSDEIVNHLMDANDSLRRSGDYRKDLQTLPVNSYGYARARLAFEIPGMMQMGRREIGFFLNQAVREAVAQHNFLGRTERYSLGSGPNQLVYVEPVLPTDLLAYTDFEVLRLLVIAQRTPPEGTQPPQTENPSRVHAFSLIERDMAASVEKDRLLAYRIGGLEEGSYGKTVQRLGVEIPGFLELSILQIGNLLIQAHREAVDHHNFLGRTERYSFEDGPNQLAHFDYTSDADQLTFPNFEVLRLLVLAQRTPDTSPPVPDAAPSLKQQAFSIIERDMAAEVEAQRTSLHLAALNTFPRGTRGYVVATIGLNVPMALQYTVNRLGGIVDRAEMRLMEAGLWKGCIEEFCAPVVAGHIVMPNRVESILAADLDGAPIYLRSIFFKYLQNGPGDYDCTCGGQLEDEGEILMNDGYRRRKYRLNSSGGSSVSTATTTSDSTSEADTITAGTYLYIGERARLAALANGVKLEVQDANGNWLTESSWIE